MTTDWEFPRRQGRLTLGDKASYDIAGWGHINITTRSDACLLSRSILYAP